MITRQLNDQESTWSFFNIFQNKINGLCPVAKESLVVLNLGKNAVSYFIKI